MIKGFTAGFHFGHTSDIDEKICKNSKVAEANPTIVNRKLASEVKLGRLAGPFSEPPLPNFKVSPISLREKKDPGKFRLIHDLSHPYDDTSINSNIPKHCKEVQYASVSSAIKQIQKLGPCCYLAKTDIESAFRLIPIHPSQYHKLGMKWDGKYFYDKCLPQGLGSSCQIFEKFSTAIQRTFQTPFAYII